VSRNRRRRIVSNGGVGALATLVLVVTCVLFILLFFQRFLSGLTAQRELVASGRRAFYLADSAINEALLDFESQVNVPSNDPNSWFIRVRKRLAADYDGLERGTYVPVLAPQLYDTSGIRVHHVEVDVWHQHSINTLPYDKMALLTITAIVEIPRRMPGLWGRYIRRNVQKSYELRHVLVTPPRPFDGFTYFLDSWGYLQRKRDEYDQGARKYDAYTAQAQSNLRLQMDSVRTAIEQVITSCANVVQEYKDVLDKIADASDITFRLEYGMSKGEARRKLREGMDQKAQELGFDHYDELVDVSTMSADCWLYAAGYDRNLATVAWPPFRSDGASLDNPVYVIDPQLRASQMELELAAPPEAPPFPTFPTGAAFNREADWQRGLTILSNAFAAWIDSWDSAIPPFQRAMQNELNRHETLFKLVPDDWVKVFRDTYEPLALADAWKDRASYVVPQQADLAEVLPTINGVKMLDGVYFVEGSLKLGSFAWGGSGALASGKTLDCDGCSTIGDGCLTLVANGELFLNGTAQAGLLAPRDCVRFRGNGVTGLASNWVHGGDDFTIAFDERLASKLADGGDNLPRFWVTVSPYHIACNFLRN